MCKFMEWTEKEVEEFCDDNSIEQVDWLKDFIVDNGDFMLKMDEDDNLVIKVRDVK